MPYSESTARIWPGVSRWPLSPLQPKLQLSKAACKPHADTTLRGHARCAVLRVKDYGRLKTPRTLPGFQPSALSDPSRRGRAHLHSHFPYRSRSKKSQWWGWGLRPGGKSGPLPVSRQQVATKASTTVIPAIPVSLWTPLRYFLVDVSYSPYGTPLAADVEPEHATPWTQRRPSTNFCGYEMDV
jgi:hypothetical protein